MMPFSKAYINFKDGFLPSQSALLEVHHSSYIGGSIGHQGSKSLINLKDGFLPSQSALLEVHHSSFIGGSIGHQGT